MVHLREGVTAHKMPSGGKVSRAFGLFFQGLAEPGPGVLPVPVGHGPGEPQHVARLLDGNGQPHP